MRVFNQLVFDQVVTGTAEAVSSSEFNDLLGKSMALYYEVEVCQVSGTNPAITVKHKASNSGRGFKDHSTLVNAQALSGTPPLRFVGQAPGPLGGLGQVAVSLGGADNTANVKIWACGRG